jgi:hypothetical protein
MRWLWVESVKMIGLYLSFDSGSNNQTCYIGLYLSTVGDLTTSHWTDGSTSTYRNWNQFAPTSLGNCVVIENFNDTAGVFNDDDCNSNRSFVCKMFSSRLFLNFKLTNRLPESSICCS